MDIFRYICIVDISNRKKIRVYFSHTIRMLEVCCCFCCCGGSAIFLAFPSQLLDSCCDSRHHIHVRMWEQEERMPQAPRPLHPPPPAFFFQEISAFSEASQKASTYISLTRIVSHGHNCKGNSKNLVLSSFSHEVRHIFRNGFRDNQKIVFAYKK